MLRTKNIMLLVLLMSSIGAVQAQAQTFYTPSARPNPTDLSTGNLSSVQRAQEGDRIFIQQGWESLGMMRPKYVGKRESLSFNLPMGRSATVIYSEPNCPVQADMQDTAALQKIPVTTGPTDAPVFYVDSPKTLSVLLTVRYAGSDNRSCSVQLRSYIPLRKKR